MSKDTSGIADRVEAVLADVVAIDIEGLEGLMQAAHECDPNQLEDPPQRFGVSRQALRMFWHFRCNLEAVMSAKEEA